MGDPELIALTELKVKLLERAEYLLEKLKEQEANTEQTGSLQVPSTLKINTSDEKLFEYYEHRLCEISRQISGITFENTDRKWLRDSLYQYTTHLVTKALTFLLELTVNLQNEKDFEIVDITCHFINIDKCYMIEIEPWVQNITKMKNLSLLVSAISQYNEQSIFRNKILNHLKAEKYANWEQCTDKNGGILIDIHCPTNLQKVLLKFQWSLLFLERTWQIENFFVINPEKTGMKFAEENQVLLKNFCKRSIEKEDLIDLWSNLCSAVDEYEGER